MGSSPNAVSIKAYEDAEEKQRQELADKQRQEEEDQKKADEALAAKEKQRLSELMQIFETKWKDDWDVKEGQQRTEKPDPPDVEKKNKRLYYGVGEDGTGKRQEKLINPGQAGTFSRDMNFDSKKNELRNAKFAMHGLLDDLFIGLLKKKAQDPNISFEDEWCKLHEDQ